MKRLLTVLSVLLLVSCGVDNKLSGDALTDAGDYLGEKANDVRDYFSDRNISGEDIQNGVNDASDDVAKAYVDGKDETGEQANEAREHMSDRNVSSQDVGQGYTDAREDVAKAYVDGKDETGEQANEARGHMSDRNVSSEDVANGYTTARTDTGAEANRTRDYLYDRGLDEMRNGDSDQERKIADHDARLKVLEQVSSNHSQLISMLFDLSSAESLARQAADESLSDALAAETASRKAADKVQNDALNSESSVRELADANEAAARAQSDSDMNADFSTQIADTSTFLQGLITDTQGELDDLSVRVSDNESDIGDIQDHLVVVDNRLDRLKNRIKAVKQLVKANSKDIRKLQRKLQREKDKRIAGDQALNDRVDTVTTYFILAALYFQGQINGLANDLSDLDTEVTDRLDDLELNVSHLQDDVEDLEQQGSGNVSCSNTVVEIDNWGSSNDYCRIQFTCTSTNGGPTVSFSQVRLDKHACD